MSPTRLLQRITGPFREFGGFAGTLYAVDRVLRGISPRLRLWYFELMAQPVPDQPLLPERLARALELRELQAGDPDLARMPIPAEIVDYRFSQGAISLGAYKKGEFIGYIWFCFERYREDEVRCIYELTPPERTVFDFDLYLFPKHRMGLGFVGIWNAANRFLRERGIDCSYSRVDRYNLASRQAHARLNWRRVGRAWFVQAWRMELMISTLRPYLNLSFSDARPPSLRLTPDVLEQAGQSEKSPRESAR